LSICIKKVACPTYNTAKRASFLTGSVILFSTFLGEENNAEILLPTEFDVDRIAVHELNINVSKISIDKNNVLCNFLFPRLIV